MSVYQCPECQYRFDEGVGDADEGYPPGTPFHSLPPEYTCPDCAVRSKDDFIHATD